MKIKNNLRITVLSSVLCLLPIILSFVIYKELPEQVAVHWNSAGNPDVYIPKAIAAFGLPVLFLAINLFSKMRLYNDPKRVNNEHSQAVQIISTWTPPLLSLVLVPITLYISMGVNIPMSIIAPIIMGIVFILCGNYLPKCRQNYTIGIKLPWTLHDADNWNKTHRMAGYLWILGGIALIIGTFISIDSLIWRIPLTILVIIPLIALPIVYSFLFYRKNGGEKQNTES